MEIIEVDNATFEIHQDFIIARFAEGSDQGLEEAVLVRALLADKFTGKFGWISDRINSYSIQPKFIEGVLEDFDHLKCMAWVTYGCAIKTEVSKLSGFIPESIEKKSFESLAEAVIWTKSYLNTLPSE
ncbi:hypothetical protein FE810_04610 [Thalassotalea litorea]|uniref:STAS/SEC14 domain-containing protein n=1 Tax=Thalassotalea litorea TaxID=2020715 RepID=A0A5R9IMK9_9GAMM|nr:hypothetical protein [Thalassotalea litorea]TLU66794.1 hypothetical protein FE810_04610 [Thalassotalea litorea]